MTQPGLYRTLSRATLVDQVMVCCGEVVTIVSCHPGHRQRLHPHREQEAGARAGGGHGLLPAGPGPASRPPSSPATRPPGSPEAAAGGREASGQHRPGHAAPGAATLPLMQSSSRPLCPGPEQAAAGVGPAAAGEPAGGPGPGRGEVRRGNVATAPNYHLQVHSRAHLGHGAVPHLLQRPDLPHGEAALPRAR